ncbi:MAG: hypothetical protein ACSHYA_12030 [Opitutaceae bacterium]
MTYKGTLHLLTAFFGLLIATMATHAQPVPAVPIEPVSTKTPPLRALTIGILDDLRNLEILDANMQPAGRLSLREFSFSSAFRCPIVDGRLIFGTQNGTNEEGVPVYKPVAAIKWDSSLKQSCLIFIPANLRGDKSGAKYVIQNLDMSPAKFKPGHTKVLNFTPVDTVTMMGEHKVSTSKWGTSSMPTVKDVTSLNMTQMGVYYKHKDRVHNPYQTQIRYLDQTRYLTIIYPNIENKRIEVRVVKDYGKLY